ncbi:ABC-2 transporter permease [Polycladomyces subterraneus]|uniref:ABC-2 transporter permease n=1 Tax=Polycladomyces subterraneus TaxID=1016997 RepID=A0ABT8IIV8_9BACL|nr:ABC-2 transporter permease [Polycladomyces subterraneus]MDN4592715.1 ABC-2 transporter permease [Polycladomyces subterraneus]
MIFKDLRVQKYMFLVALFFAFVNMLLTRMNQLVNIVILAYMLITSSIQYDEKQRTSVLLNCLPITRRSYVASKYKYLPVYIDLCGDGVSGQSGRPVHRPIRI